MLSFNIGIKKDFTGDVSTRYSMWVKVYFQLMIFFLLMFRGKETQSKLAATLGVLVVYFMLVVWYAIQIMHLGPPLGS
jgi:hypothetical protein